MDITNDQMWLWISTCRPINDTLKSQFNNLLCNGVSCWCRCWALGNGCGQPSCHCPSHRTTARFQRSRVHSPAIVVVSWSRSGVFGASDQTGHLKRKECSCLWSSVTWNAIIGTDTQWNIHLLRNRAHREDKEREKVCVNIPKVPVNELPVSLVTKYVFLVFLCVGGYIPVCVTMGVSRTFQGKRLCFFYSTTSVSNGY